MSARALLWLVVAALCEIGPALRVEQRSDWRPLQGPRDLIANVRALGRTIKAGGGHNVTRNILAGVLAARFPVAKQALKDARASEVARVDVSRAKDCLQLTTPGLELHYPKDAYEHMQEIRKAMIPFQPENVYGIKKDEFHAEHLWMGLYETFLEEHWKGRPMSDLFGPYVPIFTHWTEPWFRKAGPTKKEGKFHYPAGFWDTLRRLLRKDVPYVTVNVNDEGVPGKEYEHVTMADFPNILVLSAGGFGHVPIPLWKRIPSGYNDFYIVPRSLTRTKRDYFISYVGSLIHAPHDMRARMWETVKQWSGNHSLTLVAEPVEKRKLGELRALARKLEAMAKDNSSSYPNASSLSGLQDAASTKVIFYHNGTWCNDNRVNWQQIILSSRFNLVPRGFGRTAFHLGEVLLGGRIPIHVYTDIPWVPYRKVFETFAFHTDVEGLPALLERLMKMSTDEIRLREALIEEHVQSHWMEAGIRDQIIRLLSGRGLDGSEGSGDLICQRLPLNATGA